MEGVRVITFEPSFAKAFAELNYEWIAKFYQIEKHDHEQLDAPHDTIIHLGGQILFVLVGEEIAGTVAMIRMEGNSSSWQRWQYRPNSKAENLVIC